MRDFVHVLCFACLITECCYCDSAIPLKSTSNRYHDLRYTNLSREDYTYTKQGLVGNYLKSIAEAM